MSAAESLVGPGLFNGVRPGEEGTSRLRHSCHEPAGLDRLNGAMLESICEHPLCQTKPTWPNLNEQCSKLTCVHYNIMMRLRHAWENGSENPTFEPEFRPPIMVLDANQRGLGGR